MTTQEALKRLSEVMNLIDSIDIKALDYEQEKLISKAYRILLIIKIQLKQSIK